MCVCAAYVWLVYVYVWMYVVYVWLVYVYVCVCVWSMCGMCLIVDITKLWFESKISSRSE